jgi:hypothetical protein
VSPERKLAELGTKGEVWRVPEMRVGDERRVRIVAEGTSPGDGGETDADAAEAKAGTAETDTAKAEADTIYIVAGVPNRARNGAPTAPRLNQRAVAKMASDFEKVRRHTDSKWHEQGWRGSTNDPFRHDHKSSQFGWSTMSGGAEKQEAARLEGKPFKLNAWEIPQGREFYKNHLAPRLPGWFQCVEDRFPALSKEMRRRVPQEYWLAGTPFTKITVAINNATPVHYDQKNFGLTFLACFDLDEQNRVVGGSHCLFCLDNKRAIVVTDTKDGVYMVGDYRRVLHSNLASRSGRRLIVTCYTSKTLVDLVEK